MFDGIRKNKENIVYFFLTVLCLEIVRVKYNRLEESKKKPKFKINLIYRKQSLLLLNASLIYGVFLSFIVLNFTISLIGKITSVYPDTSFLKTNMALIINLAVSYMLAVIVVRILLKVYITNMNNLTEFWKRLGRRTWDGAKVVAQVPAKTKEAVKDTAKVGSYAAQRIPANVKEVVTDKDHWNYDELIGKISQLGIPALVLIVAIEITGLVGAAAITAGLASLGGPFGMLGGIAALGLLVVISKGVGKFGFKAVFEGVLLNLYKKRHSKEEIISKINKYKISTKMKQALIKYINQISDEDSDGQSVS